MKKFKLAIVGATGLVGRMILKVLEEKNLPISEYVLFASSKSAGTKLTFMGQDYIVHELKEDSFDIGFDFAIFSAGSSTSKKYAPIAASKGCVVVDNSSAFRMDPDVPLVVPEVNPEEIKNNHGIIANPNCSTIQAVVALKPLDDKYKIKRIVYSTYQAVSGAGRYGVEDLENGIKDFINQSGYINNFDSSPNKFNNISNITKNESYADKLNYNELKKFDFPIFSNCLPHIDVFLDSGYTKEEEKMINETRKILKKPDLKITATTVRVPVFNSHSEAINVEFEKPFEMVDLVNSLSSFSGLIVQDNIVPKTIEHDNTKALQNKITEPEQVNLENPIYPIAINASGHDEVFVGRIRRDYSVESGINFWVVADNIRKGAASNAIQIVEKMIEQEDI